MPITISNINYIDALYSILIYEHISQYKYGSESKIMSNITENLLFQDYNQIIDEVINNIMLEEQKKTPLGLNISKKNNNNEYYLDNEDIPSKSINNKRIKLDNNMTNDNRLVKFNDKKKNKNNNYIKECKLRPQINNLNV